MARSNDSTTADACRWLGAIGWGTLALGILGVVLYGVSLATPWSLKDPLGLRADSTAAPDPALFQRALDDALDQAWALLGGRGGGVKLAELATDEDRLHRATQLVDGVLASRPHDVRAHVLQGLVHMASGERDAARRSLERSLELGGGQQSYLVLGALHADAGELARAEAVFRRALEKYPDAASAWNNLGMVLSQQGRQDEADEAFRRWQELTGRAAAARPTDPAEPSTSAGTPAAADGDR